MDKITDTDRAIAAQLVENTGRALMDSGDYYGRNFERNAGLTVEDLLARPDVTVHQDYYTIDLFHWLRTRVTFDPEQDAAFQEFVTQDDEENGRHHWLESAERWAAFVTSDDPDYDGWSDDYLDGVYNSYNGDESLSQTIQFVIYTDPQRGTYVALQVHGGCDVRGGYTRPVIYSIDGDAASMLDWDAIELYCPGPVPPQQEALALDVPDPEPHALDIRDGEVVTYGGEFARMGDLWPRDEDDNETWIVQQEDGYHIRCPYCGGVMQAHTQQGW